MFIGILFPKLFLFCIYSLSNVLVVQTSGASGNHISSNPPISLALWKHSTRSLERRRCCCNFRFQLQYIGYDLLCLARNEGPHSFEQIICVAMTFWDLVSCCHLMKSLERWSIKMKNEVLAIFPLAQHFLMLTFLII